MAAFGNMAAGQRIMRSIFWFAWLVLHLYMSFAQHTHFIQKDCARKLKAGFFLNLLVYEIRPQEKSAKSNYIATDFYRLCMDLKDIDLKGNSLNHTLLQMQSGQDGFAASKRLNEDCFHGGHAQPFCAQGP